MLLINILMHYFLHKHTFACTLLCFVSTLCFGNGSLSDAEFFASLNLQSNELAKVKTALEHGDTTAAKQHLHDFYLKRTTVKYFELSTGGNAAEADDNLANNFTIVGVTLFAGNEDGSVNWNLVYSPDDEWHWQFHRMEWLINLARIYQKTGDEKYAKGWISHLTDWSRNNPPGYPRTLDTGNRLCNWVESYQYMVHLLKTPSLGAEEHIEILKSLIQQARFLHDNWKADSNWGASETRGLNEVLVMFPEFNFYPGDSRDNWIKLVQDRLLYHLNENFLEDGVQFETSPMYHYLSYRNLLVAYQLMVINNIPASSEFDSLFILPAEYIMHITKPDGYIPQLGDADKTDRHLEYLRIAAEIYNRNDFRFVASRGTTGQPPTETFRAFQHGKNIVMRSGWGTNTEEMLKARYLVFNYSSNQPWHAHFDMLSIEASANGKNIILDPGRYTYGEDDSWRNYFISTSAHNTIVVNNQNQLSYKSANAEWVSLPGFDYVNAFHDAYTLRQQQVLHKRKVFFVKPDYWIITDVLTGTGSHTLDLYFHIDPEYNLNHTFNNVSQTFSTPDFEIAPSNINADADVNTGWVSFEYGTKLEAPVLKYSKTGVLPKTFETVIFPFDKNDTQLQVNTLESFNRFGNAISSDQAVTIKVEIQGGKDILGFNHSFQEPIFVNPYSYSGEAVHVRVTNEDNILRYGLINGTTLKMNGVTLVETGNDTVSISYNDLILSIEGQTINGFKAWAPGVQNVIINHESVPFSYIDDYVYYGTFPTINNTQINTPLFETLEQNYPNPFSSSTTISFFLHRGSQIKLTIFDSIGKNYQTLVNKYFEAGKQSLVFSGSSLDKGIYFYKLETEYGVFIKKMILAK